MKQKKVKKRHLKISRLSLTFVTVIRRLIKLGGILLILHLLLMVTGYDYLYKAIWYNFPGIYDGSIFPARMVEKGQAVSWKKASDFNTGVIPDSIIKLHEKNQSVAYLASRNDSLIHEQYWDGHHENKLSGSFSMAKTLVSILVGIAIKEHKITSLDDPVSKYIPSFNSGEKKQITIRHLLNMSSGINWDESYSNPFSITTKAYYGSNIERMVQRMKSRYKPGKIFDYMSGNQLVLALVLRKATGKNISEYMSEKLWKPMGSEHNATWNLDHDNGVEKGYCCVNAVARDFMKLGLIYLYNGNIHGNQIVDKGYVKESLTPASLYDTEMNRCNWYGLSWWIGEIEHKGKKHAVYYMRGILGQYVAIVPDYKITVCRLGHHRDDALYELGYGHHKKDVFRYISGILQAYIK